MILRPRPRHGYRSGTIFQFHHLLAIFCIFTAGLASADDKAVPAYVTSKEINAMPSCKATFTKRLSEYGGSFTTTEGKEFVLGNNRGDQWVWHFVGALREGQSYKLPDEFVNYQAAPHYVTAKEIAAIPACTATIATRSPCSSYFKTDDGKWFGIGSPSSDEQVSHFIWSRKEGQKYKFPDAFADFQAAPHFGTAKEISQMAPRTATLVAVFSDSCYFTTKDGKGFHVGDERSEKDVDKFLRTLEEDKDYKLPDIFLEYQKQNKGE